MNIIFEIRSWTWFGFGIQKELGYIFDDQHRNLFTFLYEFLVNFRVELSLIYPFMLLSFLLWLILLLSCFHLRRRIKWFVFMMTHVGVVVILIPKIGFRIVWFLHIEFIGIWFLLIGLTIIWFLHVGFIVI
jgi:hypothetical protein